MNKFFLFIILLFGFTVKGQLIRFNYDNAGNQIIRYWCSSCGAKSGNNKDIEEIAKLEDATFQKFHPEDTFSYYPNPVKEELFLKWPLQENKRVKNINVYNLGGQLVKQYVNLQNEQTQNIPFGSFPVASYILVLEYTNGEQKSINILKK